MGECRKRGHPSSWIRPTTRHRVYKRDGVRCVYCQWAPPVGPGRFRDLTLDHVKPRSKGGTNHPRNLVTACRSCNSSLQHRAPTPEWCKARCIDFATMRRNVRNATRRKLP